MGFASSPDVEDLTTLFLDGELDPAYLTRAFGMVTLQSLAVFVPGVILIWQLLSAFPCSSRLLPHRLQPLKDEQAEEWITRFQEFTNADDRLIATIRSLDSVDFNRFQTSFEITMARSSFELTMTRSVLEEVRMD